GQFAIVCQLHSRARQLVPFREQSSHVRVFPHDFAGAIAIFKKGRVCDFAFELFETLAFTLNEKIKVHRWLVAAALCRRVGAPRESGAATSKLSLARASGLGAAVAASEFFYAPGRINKFLFAGEKRMAGGTDADFNVSFGRA